MYSTEKSTEGICFVTTACYNLFQFRVCFVSFMLISVVYPVLETHEALIGGSSCTILIQFMCKVIDLPWTEACCYKPYHAFQRVCV